MILYLFLLAVLSVFALYIFKFFCYVHNGSSLLYIILTRSSLQQHKIFLFILFAVLVLINSFILFIYFWLHWVFVAVCWLSLVAESGGYSLLQCVSFSCCGAWALGAWASVVVARGLSSCGSWALEHRLSSCGAWT